MQPLFDAHLHIIDPRFPLTPNRGYLPEPFTVSDYRAATAEYQLVGGAVVSGSFQGFDQDYLVAALERLGPGFVGVTQLPHDAADEEILRLDAAGVRAVRFNLKRGGSAEVAHLESMARRVYKLAGWHVELYVDARELEPLRQTLSSLPAVSIDHLGLAAAGFDTLLQLVEQGVKVKATGFGRIDFDVASAIEQIITINPESLMFGTDLPSTRASRPYDPADYRLVHDLLDPEIAERVLVTNAREFYRVGSNG